MQNNEIYLYANVPFCLKRCSYCYCTLVFSDEELLSFKKNAEPFTAALLNEIASFNGSDKKCRGISFGGGTPSLLSVPQLERILKASTGCCASLDDKAQISIEIFPGTKTREELKAIRDMGFNRVSLGAQSFDDEELRFFGRAHDTEAFYKAYEDVRAVGFDNINIDLLFNLPNSSIHKWQKSVDAALALQPEHLTTYYWYPTMGNDFHRRIAEGTLELPSRETGIEQYQYAINTAAEHGMEHYWDFNFARPGYQYNIERDTFRFFPIRGFGPGAWTQENSNIVQNPTGLRSYLVNSPKRLVQKCTVDYYVMRSLMFPQGVVFSEFEDFFNQKWSLDLMSDSLREAFDSWVDKDLVDTGEDAIRFKKEMAATSSVYLAEYQTKSIYCPQV